MFNRVLFYECNIHISVTDVQQPQLWLAPVLELVNHDVGSALWPHKASYKSLYLSKILLYKYDATH